MSQDLNTTFYGSTQPKSPIPHKVRLYATSQLAAFNELFPDGIPTAQAEPNLSLGNWECYEAIIPDTLNTCDLTIALFQPDTPIPLCRAWLEWGIVALPIDWVEVC